MENALRACCKGIKIGKILIHREGDNGQQVNESLLFHSRCSVSSLLMSVSLCSLFMRNCQMISQRGMSYCWILFSGQVINPSFFITFYWKHFISYFSLL